MRPRTVKVVGFGGAGRNVLDAMVPAETGAEYLAMDTDHGVVAGTASAAVAEFGKDVGRAAAERAICTPIVNLEAALASAPWVLVSVTCSARFEGAAAHALAEVQRVAPHRAKFVLVHVPDDALGDEVRVTVITGGVTASAERAWWSRRTRDNPSPVFG